MINGSASLDEVKDYLNVELPVEEYETLSGFVIGQLGKIPGKEDNPTVEFNGLIFKVEEVEEKRVAKVKVSRV
jgi:Hemolysins and related proteins containing CBS domains